MIASISGDSVIDISRLGQRLSSVTRLSRPKSALTQPKRFRPYYGGPLFLDQQVPLQRDELSTLVYNSPDINKKDRAREIEQAGQLEARAREILAKAGSNTDVDNMLQTIKDYSGLLKRYSAANSALIYWQDPNATLVHSRADWKRLGRDVREDAKPIAVLIPLGGGRKVSEPEIAHLIERRRKKGVPDPEIQHEVRKLIAKGAYIPTHTFGVGKVYDAKSVTGGPVLSEKEHLKVSEVYTLATAYARSQYDVEFGPVGFARGYSNLVKKEDGSISGHISVLKVPGEEIQPLDTLVHEMSHHVLGHTGKLSNDEYKKNRGKYEAETQLTSFLVLNHYGIDNRAHTSVYVGQWLKNNDQKSMGEQSIARSMNAAKTIIQGIEAQREKQLIAK